MIYLTVFDISDGKFLAVLCFDIIANKVGLLRVVVYWQTKNEEQYWRGERDNSLKKKKVSIPFLSHRKTTKVADYSIDTERIYVLNCSSNRK